MATHDEVRNETYYTEEEERELQRRAEEDALEEFREAARHLPAAILREILCEIAIAEEALPTTEVAPAKIVEITNTLASVEVGAGGHVRLLVAGVVFLVGASPTGAVSFHVMSEGGRPLDSIGFQGETEPGTLAFFDVRAGDES